MSDHWVVGCFCTVSRPQHLIGEGELIERVYSEFMEFHTQTPKSLRYLVEHKGYYFDL
jgi:hypothetical protein